MKEKKINKENIFFILNIVLIIGIIITYLVRAIYYYKKTNYIPKTESLYDAIVNLKNIVNQGDGLYDQGDEVYYFKGKNVNNYIIYSDTLWRIVEISKEKIKIVSEENETTLVYGVENTYEDSYVRKFLNDDKLIKSLYRSEDYIVNGNWCNESIDINNYNCNAKLNDLVGLINIQDYLRAGAKDSYLNNNTYWWTISISKENEVYYIDNEGEIENQNKFFDTYFSYGVRPSLNLNGNIKYLSGDGTKDNPYIIEDNMDIEINNHSIGTYIKYKNYVWKIMETSNNYTKVILDGYILSENSEPLKLNYYEAKNYLETTFINELNIEDLVKLDFYYGNYDKTNKYNFDFTNQSVINSYIGFPVIGDIHITDYSNVWLDNSLTSDEKLIYKTIEGGRVFADFSNSENYIRPVIGIKKGLIISGGVGTKDNPLVIGDEK